ncbi:phosphonate metabolism transcriptional regulator PhnF [Pseudorhodoplanes sinuspersici]|uniref:Phosphonate metabolism transcriptional regulator PhnF n=1 Tax=Pseudorhodoplanes sinuspersici TaxID=1235591 RepID=A0A1W6ZYM7_9HYPH|nr:phosphonate metabolism transcriptional regulator PhnF [Pseudorhodoplanes sinuspersici]ARQ02509.1 phosphonate metabolism transcriptional regulator PhnF [Pseudorhodoplanes sinuspersici]RKE74349.1 GntR family transcriptional regulator [Pseudorhodoplanes sinuspersici]
MAHSGEALNTVSPAGVMLWRKIADDIEHAIVRGDFATGEKLPSEQDIADRFGVNRHTVRRALAELTERGLVRAERGSGTYVEPARISYPIRARTRFSEIINASGRMAGGRLLASSKEPAPRDIALRLDLPPNAMTIRLEILRSANRVPISLGTTWLPADLAPDAAKIYRAARSVSRLLAHIGFRDYKRRDTRVSAAMADAIHAAKLQLTPGRPLIVVDSVDIASDGRPILTSHARFAADRVELVIEN